MRQLGAWEDSHVGWIAIPLDRMSIDGRIIAAVLDESGRPHGVVGVGTIPRRPNFVRLRF